jgi:hypothetical protein
MGIEAIGFTQTGFLGIESNVLQLETSRTNSDTRRARYYAPSRMRPFGVMM